MSAHVFSPYFTAPMANIKVEASRSNVRVSAIILVEDIHGSGHLKDGIQQVPLPELVVLQRGGGDVVRASEVQQEE